MDGPVLKALSSSSRFSPERPWVGSSSKRRRGHFTSFQHPKPCNRNRVKQAMLDELNISKRLSTFPVNTCFTKVIMDFKGLECQPFQISRNCQVTSALQRRTNFCCLKMGSNKIYQNIVSQALQDFLRLHNISLIKMSKYVDLIK